MPKIQLKEVQRILRNHYFDHHTAMHLSRERVKVYDPDRMTPDGKSRPGIIEVAPLLDPAHKCEECKDMIEAGTPGSGRELLIMHHEMLRVLDYLLYKEGIHFAVKWEHDHNHGKPSSSKWVRDDNGGPCYAPEALWDLDDPKALPQEIRALFSYADGHYLHDVFDGVKRLVETAGGERGEDAYRDDGPIDKLGRFIEAGAPSGPPKGRGFHNTIHECLGSREGRSATGAEMNELRHSLFNDYFWSLHLWMDGQYGRLLENLGEKFETGREEPGDPMDAMQKAMHGRMKDSGKTAPVGP